jgi:hypothetical protein
MFEGLRGWPLSVAPERSPTMSKDLSDRDNRNKLKKDD